MKYTDRPLTRELLLDCCNTAAACSWPWPADATSESQAGAEDALRALMSAISRQIEAVAANAAAAIASVEHDCNNRLARALPEERAAVQLHREIATSAIDTAKNTKIASLEAQLVTVDSVLEFAQGELAALRETAADLEGTATGVVALAVFSRLGSIFSRIQGLPPVPVEPSLIEYWTPVTSSLVATRVLAPRGVRATDVMEPVIASQWVSPGGILQIQLRLSAAYAKELAGPRQDALGSVAIDQADAFYPPYLHCLRTVLPVLASGIRVLAVMETTAGAVRLAGQGVVSCSPDDTLPGVSVRIAIPRTAEPGTLVFVESVQIHGTVVTELPLQAKVSRGLIAPWARRLNCSNDILTPCVLPDGLLVVPAHRNAAAAVFAPSGELIRFQPVAPLTHVSRTSMTAVSYDEVTETLFLCDERGLESKLVAMDVAAVTVKWSSPDRCFDDCGGLAVLSRHGVVVCSSKCEHRLVVFRISDGAVLQSVKGPEYVTYLAADQTTGTVYASTGIGCDPCIQAFVWDEEHKSLVKQDDVVAGGEMEERRPMTVMPPAPGKRHSHLILGCQMKEELRVIELPSLTLVCTTSLKTSLGDGIMVQGLASDPHGAALVVLEFFDEREIHDVEATLESDSDFPESVIRVMPWPLPGMPHLE